MSSVKVRFRNLDRTEVDKVLSRNHIGRVAFAQGNRPEIVPVSYVFTPEWIYGRTSPGGAIGRIGETWWPVAFQVDEVNNHFDWKSVVVHGGLYVVPGEGARWQREAWQEGLDLLRQLVPETFAEGDPVPQRQTIFRIAIQEVTGKAAEPG